MENTQQILDLLNSDDASVRKNAVESILVSPSDEIIKKLCDMISDDDKGIRNTISLKLGFNPDWNAAKYLVKYISSDDISVRNLAGDILIKIGKNAVVALEEHILMANEADQKFILDVLGLIGDPSVGPVTLKVLEESPYDNVILACIETLGNVRHSEAVNALVSFF